MGNPKALGHTRTLQWLGLNIACPIVPDQEIARAGAHPAGPVEEQNSGHTFIVHRGARSVTAWHADMTDVMRSTVSPAYSAERSTADSAPKTNARRAKASRSSDGTGQLRACQSTTHSGPGHRNGKAKPIQQVHERALAGPCFGFT
jgi:hypothetical protein